MADEDPSQHDRVQAVDARHGGAANNLTRIVRQATVKCSHSPFWSSAGADAR